MNFFGFGKKKRKISAAELGDMLLEEIFNEQYNPPIEHLSLSPDEKDIVVSKVDFYRQAALLRVVIIQELSNSKFAVLKNHLETIIFRASSQEEGMQIVREMKLAMLSLDELNELVKPMSWSRNWLKDIGIDESNPVPLQLFGSFWIDCSTAFYKTLNDFDPV